MAAVAPALQGAPPNPVALAAAAGAANLRWDATLVPPTVPGGPPNPAVTTPWNGALPLGPNAAAFMFCNDRLQHGVAGFGPALNPGGGPLRRCAHPWNPVPWPPGAVYNDMLWHPCPRLAGLHGPGFTVCYYCLAHTRAQPWWQRIFANVSTVPPTLRWPFVGPPGTPQQPINAWMQFQTHLCRECEVVEQRKLLDFRNPNTVTPPPANNAKMIRDPRGWSVNSCTCLYELLKAGPLFSYCVPHRHEIASNRHNTLLITRQQNDNWLRNIERVPGTKRIRFCSPQKRNGRVTRRVFRACRCGAEIRIVAGRQPEVMCLGCEGVIHVGALAAGGAALPAATVPDAGTRAGGNVGLRRRR